MLDLYINIKKLREAKGMSQDELAELTGYSDRSSIAKIEKGLVDLPQTKILSFAKALGVSPSQLMGWSETENKPQTLAAHFEGEDFTEEEIEEIMKFAEFVKNKRK